MNERIKKLYIQTANETADGKEWAIGGMNNAEIFAELIVRECLEQIDKIRDGCEDDGEDQQALGADWAGLAIARYFGVEE